LFCLLALLLTHPALAAQSTLDAQLILASNSADAQTRPALQEVVQQLASKGIRSATLLDTNLRVDRASLAAHKHTVDIRIAAASAKRARVVVKVESKGKVNEVALEVPKNREVLIGIGRTDAGLLVASLNVNGHLDGR